MLDTACSRHLRACLRAPAGSLLRVVVLPFAVDDAVFLAPLRLGGWIITDGNGLGTCEETALRFHFRALGGWFLVCFLHFSFVDDDMIFILFIRFYLSTVPSPCCGRAQTLLRPITHNLRTHKKTLSKFVRT